jgi:hypothetical protein
MDETCEDEATVRPIDHPAALSLDMQIVVRATFITSAGHRHVGYIYWRRPTAIDALQPVLFIGNLDVTFWNGIRKPDAEYLREIRETLGVAAFPIRFASVPLQNLPSLSGLLHGIYYWKSGVVLIRL